ncbi:MAG: hypothetical protein K2N90_09490 [Lachnospiraceae bacterium]|nr:hypothetical protein [Lachnospiraceae bacterium]
MITKRKEASIALLIWTLLILYTAGCGRKETGVEVEVPKESIAQEETGTSGTELAEEEASFIKEIPVDFPFDELYPSKPYSLMLALQEEPVGTYVLRLYNGSGEVLQQIPCGILAEPVQFSYDDIFHKYGFDLEIFPADSSTGLLFQWDGEQFSEEAVAIPKYSQMQGRAMLVIEEEETLQIKKLYQLNEEQKCVEEARGWRLQKDTGELEIRNYLDNQILFQGIVPLNDEGNPVNEVYYNMLFAEDLYAWWEEPEETTISTWFDEPRTESTAESEGIEPFENMQKRVFGNDGHTTEYESREALLADCGFADSVPMYQYYDRYKNLQLELYRDETSDRFCGIVYKYYMNGEKKKWAEMYGFTVNTVSDQEWAGAVSFFGKNIYGNDMGDYEELIEYTSSGLPAYICYQGVTERENGLGELSKALEPVMEVNYVYRDDGTLFYREYWHDSIAFETTLSSLHSFYDDVGRVVYENGYITHGTLEYYYIYEGESKKPAYCLEVDHNVGYAISNIVRYQ